MNVNGNGVAKMPTKIGHGLGLRLELCRHHKNSIKSNRMKSRRIADSNIIPLPPSPCTSLLCPWLTPLQTSLDSVEAAAPSPLPLAS